MKSRLKPLVALLAACPLYGIAAEIPSLDEVVVTATKTRPLPVSAQRLGAPELAPMRASTSDTASLLRDIPGVSLQGSGGVSSLPVMHGLADDRLRVKVDDMDLIASCPNHMNPVLSYIDPGQVEAVKVYAGLSPVSVGGDSIGGSIVVKSAEPVFAKAGQGSLAQGEAGAFYRSNGNAYGANLAATYATESFNISYAGATAKSDNYDAGGDFKQAIYGSAVSPTVTGRTGHTLALDEVGSTAYETRNHTLGLAFRSGEHLVEAKFGMQDLPYQLWPNQRMDMLDNQENRVNLRYKGDFDWGALEARAYHQTVDHFMDFGTDKRYYYSTDSGGAAGIGGSGNGGFCSPISATCAWGMPMYTASKTTGVSLKTDIHLTPEDLLRIGGEYQTYQLDDWWEPSGGGMWPNTFWNVRNGERDRMAIFGEWEKKIDPRWQTLTGLRFERVDMNADTVHGYNLATFPTVAAVSAGNQTRDAAAFNNADRAKTDNNWDLTALAKYSANPNYDIEFGYAHKTRSPNLHERYVWSTWQMAALMVNWVGDGNGYIGNLDLKPEKADTLSATFDWHAADRDWEFKATPYYTRVADYIDAVQWNATTNTARTTPVTPAQFTVLKFMNQDARLYGLDLSGKMPLGQTGIGALGLKGLLNYTHGKNLDTGDGLYNIMPLNAKLTLTHKLGGWDNAVELVMVKGKSDGSAVRNEIDTPGYSLVNLRGSYSWKQVRVDFGVENLFDKLYYLPTGGAYLGQGTTMSAGAVPAGSVPAWGTAVPGAGRSLYAGLNVKF